MSQQYTPISKQIEVDASALARRLFWHPYSLGTILLDQPDHHEPYEKPGAHLFWVISGRGTLDTQGYKYSLAPGNSVWFVDMLYPRTYTPEPGKRLTIRGIRFGARLLEPWHEVLGGSKHAEFVLRDRAELRRALSEISRLVTLKPVAWEWQVHLILNRIMGMLLASLEALGNTSTGPPLPVRRVLKAVAAAPERHWRAKELVQIGRVSYSSLRVLFCRSQGETLQQFLQAHPAGSGQAAASRPGGVRH